MNNELTLRDEDKFIDAMSFVIPELRPDKLTKIMVRVEVKVGENGKIFGGVSAKDIAENLEKQHNIKIDKQNKHHLEYNEHPY